MNMVSRWHGNDAQLPSSMRGWDELMNSFFGAWPTLKAGWLPEGAEEMEVEVGDDSVIASIPLAGYRNEDIEVEVVGDCLTVRATRKEEKNIDEKSRYVRRERTNMEFSESVRLPVQVVGPQAKAEYADGVLKVTLPRMSCSKPASHVVKVE